MGGLAHRRTVPRFDPTCARELELATHQRIPICLRAHGTYPDKTRADSAPSHTHAEIAPVGSHDSRPPIAPQRSIGHDQRTQAHPASRRLPPTTTPSPLTPVGLFDHGRPLFFRRTHIRQHKVSEVRCKLSGIRPVKDRGGYCVVYGFHAAHGSFASTHRMRLQPGSSGSCSISRRWRQSRHHTQIQPQLSRHPSALWARRQPTHRKASTPHPTRTPRRR